VRWFVVFGIIISLTLQTFGPVLWGNNDSESSLIIKNIWLIGPTLGWVFGAYFFLRHARIKNRDVFALSWIIFLIVHSLLAGFQNGINEAISSFLSWGAWFGIYFWLAHDVSDNKKILDTVCAFLVLIGMFVAASIIYEAISGSILTHTVTTGDHSRRCGISQSVVIAGIQIGCGIFSLEYLLIQTRSKRIQAFFCFVFLTLCAGLILTASRGPLFLVVFYWGILYFFRIRLLGKRALSRPMLLVASFLLLVALMIQKNYLDPEIKKFIGAAITKEDEGNQGRFMAMEGALLRVTASWESLIFGEGLGTSGILAKIRDQGESTSESSLLRLWQEGGLLGLILFVGICFSVIWQGMLIQASKYLYGAEGKRVKAAHMVLLLSVLLVLSESFFHDMLTTWIISGCFWLILGLLQAMNNFALDQMRSRGYSNSRFG